MAYTAWSVVFGEQPSSAKWNILGTNDASFADGTGIDDGAITSAKLVEAFLRGRKQVVTTDTAPTGLTLQHGWSFVAGAGSNSGSKTITFPTAFSSAPIVILGALGRYTGTPTAIGNFNNGWSRNIGPPVGKDVTTTTFNAFITSDSTTGSDLVSGDAYGFSWIAIGAV